MSEALKQRVESALVLATLHLRHCISKRQRIGKPNQVGTRSCCMTASTLAHAAAVPAAWQIDAIR
jgi:hypothetical protein